MFSATDASISPSAIRVLIAEDSLVIGNLLRFNIEQAGFQATLVGNGLEAIEALKAQEFDILLTDYEMPLMNGEQTCEAVREVLGIKEMPIVMCSAKCLELDETRLKAAYGVDRLLHKPFSMTDLVVTLRTLVETKLTPVSVEPS